MSAIKWPFYVVFCALIAFAAVQSEAGLHDPLCQNIRPGADIDAEACLQSFLKRNPAAVNYSQVRVSADSQAFEAMRRILKSYKGQGAEVKRLDYADFVGFAQTAGPRPRLLYYVLDAGAFVFPQMLLNVSVKDLGLFFNNLQQEPDTFYLELETFNLNF